MTFSAFSVLATIAGSLHGQASVRPVAGAGEIPPRFAARVAEKIGATWGVDPSAVVLRWGTGSLAGLPDSAAFRLLGRGEGGWFAVTIEQPGRPIVAIRVRAGITGQRLVAARALRVGMRLVEDDIRLEPNLEWGPPPAASVTPGPGWVVRRLMTPGDALDPTRVSPPPVIESGQQVRMLWNEGNVSITLEGIAIQDAALGQQVRVRSPVRGGTLVGVATAIGEARMQ